VLSASAYLAAAQADLPVHFAAYSASSSFSCSVTSVHDGDTFRCSDGIRVRLSSIDAPEMPGACQPGRHCAPGDPYAARDLLRRLIGGRIVQCQAVGTSYDRVVAWCSVAGVDLSRAMVSGGYAICLPKFDVDHRLCR
jgi:endonuclease YncB( thermonuclease family)